MDDPDAEENLKFLHNMCIKEHAKFVSNLPRLSQKIAQLAVMPHNGQDSSMCNVDTYDRSVDCLTNTTNLLRKLNIQIESMALTVTKETVPVDEAELPTAVCPPPVAGPEVTKRNKDPFVQPKYDLQRYTPQYSGTAIVTHVPEASTDDRTIAVYMIDTETPFANVIFALSLADCQPICRVETVQQKTTILSSDAMFGVQLEANIFRSMRSTARVSPFTVNLIDTGEIIELSPDSMLYSLAEKYRILPAQALHCRATEYGPTAQQDSNVRTFLQSHLYQRVRFHVIGQRSDNILEVSVHKLHTSMNPFLDMIEDIPCATDTVDKSIVSTVETALPASRQQQRAAVIAMADLALDPNDRYVDGTSNAMVAVTGYNPHDDARLCPHYDPRTGACFKGAHCRLEHNAKLTDGWTRDQRTVVVRARIPQPWPAIDMTVTCVPTHIVHVDSFFAQIVPTGSQELQLTELTRRLNAVEAVHSLRPFDAHRRPEAQELVLARYKDGLWHRARILDVDDVAMSVAVFFVDYGNSYVVAAEDLRHWDGRFEFLPFQAYEFRLLNVKRRTEQRNFDDIAVVNRLLLHRQMLALVKSNLGVLCVILSGRNGEDIGAALLAMDLVVPVGETILPKGFGKDELPYPL